MRLCLEAYWVDHDGEWSGKIAEETFSGDFLSDPHDQMEYCYDIVAWIRMHLHKTHEDPRYEARVGARFCR